MALSKVDYNSLNVTAAASKALKWNSTPNGFETGDVAGSMALLETQTASSSATISFTSNIDSTYKEYIFKYYDIHPSADGAHLTFNGSADSGSNYNLTKTSAWYFAYIKEDDTDEAHSYSIYNDLAQSTDFQILASDIGNDNDQSASGELFLFNPSSDTFVKHFLYTGSSLNSGDYLSNDFVGGYFNTTSAIDAIQFKMESGNIDAGTIKLYGIKDS